MREKKRCAVLTFRTTTEAMAMERRCGEQGIPGRLIPVPKEIAAGCGLAWRMEAEDYARLRPELERLGLRFQRAAEMMLY